MNFENSEIHSFREKYLRIRFCLVTQGNLKSSASASALRSTLTEEEERMVRILL